VGVGIGEFGFADASEAVDSADDAGAIGLEAVAEGEEFVDAAGEVLVVGRDGVGASSSAADAFGFADEVFGEAGEDALEAFVVEGAESFVIEGVNLEVLAAGNLLEELVAGVGDFNKVDGVCPIGKDVFGDFGIDPGAPFAAAPVAGEVIGGDES
jgi:hypothetical protein